MALRRYTTVVDGTIPVQALLYNDEELFASQDDVGIYDGSQKAPDHQLGTIYVTSHRLFFINAHKARSKSFELALSSIGQTEHYAGLFTSSPKVTCHLSGNPVGLGSNKPDGGHATQFDSWECEVCAYRNPPGFSPSAARVCDLCGVPRTAVPTPVTSGSSHHLSTSLPTSALSSSTSLPSRSRSSISNITKAKAKTVSSIACPACTFLNHPSLRSCEICSTDLPQHQPQLRSAPSSRPITPDSDDEDDTSPKSIKISFRKGGDKPFYTMLKRALKSKSWEEPSTSSLLDANSTDSDRRNAPGRSGISGILRTVETSAKGRESHMQDALQDLEAFMVKAKDMVKLAAELNEKLTAVASASASASTSSANNNAGGGGSDSGGGGVLLSTTGVAEPEEATFIRSSLSQLGLQMENTPVTLDMMKDERKWHDELARELTRVLQGSGSPSSANNVHENTGLMKDRGIIALDEVWGGWNRARGVALIPPSTLLQVLPLLPSHTNPPLLHRVFASGLNVLHTPPYSQAAFSARLSSFLMMSGPKSTIDISTVEGLTVALVSEMIEDVERDGGVVRDDSNASITGGGSGTGVEVKWWGNVFHGYIWDGQE